MDKTLLLFFTILAVLVLSWIFQGLRLRRSCKGDIYPALFGGFLPYFYRYVILRDCSESGHLRSLVGRHKLVFSTVNTEEGQRVRFCVLFFEKGILVLCYDKMWGAFQGRAAGKDWKVTRPGEDGKTHAYRYHNPTGEFKGYLSRIATLFPQAHLEARLAFPDGSDFSQLSSDVKVIRFEELERELRAIEAPTLPEDEVLAMYRQLIGK